MKPPQDGEDSTAALQQALDQLGARGGLLLLPPALYTVRQTLTLRGARDVQIMGVGGRGGATVLAPGKVRGTLLSWLADGRCSWRAWNCKTAAPCGRSGAAGLAGVDALFPGPQDQALIDLVTPRPQSAPGRRRHPAQRLCIRRPIHGQTRAAVPYGLQSVDILPLTYDRALVDPGGASRLLVSFTCGTDPIDHEWQTPACIERCMKALYAAHPEVAAALIKLMLGRF